MIPDTEFPIPHSPIPHHSIQSQPAAAGAPNSLNSEPRPLNPGPGRPPIFDAVKQHTFLRLVSVGFSTRRAARLVGVCPSTVREKARTSPPFACGYEDAKAQAIPALAENVYHAGKRSWRASAWLLERLRPSQFGHRVALGPDRAKIQAEKRARELELQPIHEELLKESKRLEELRQSLDRREALLAEARCRLQPTDDNIVVCRSPDPVLTPTAGLSADDDAIARFMDNLRGNHKAQHIAKEELKRVLHEQACDDHAKGWYDRIPDFGHYAFDDPDEPGTEDSGVVVSRSIGDMQPIDTQPADEESQSVTDPVDDSDSAPSTETRCVSEDNSLTESATPTIETRRVSDDCSPTDSAQSELPHPTFCAPPPSAKNPAPSITDPITQTQAQQPQPSIASSQAPPNSCALTSPAHCAEMPTEIHAETTPAPCHPPPICG